MQTAISKEIVVPILKGLKQLTHIQWILGRPIRNHMCILGGPIGNILEMECKSE